MSSRTRALRTPECASACFLSVSQGVSAGSQTGAIVQIYQQSPSFAKVKSYLDPDGKPSPWNYGCDLQPQTCGDIAGGWFIWAFRDAAQSVGMYKNAYTAAQFYEQHERGRCGVRAGTAHVRVMASAPCSIHELQRNSGRAVAYRWILEFIAMVPPLSVDAAKSQIEDAARARVLEFLNYPTHVEAPSRSIQPQRLV